MLNLQLFKTIDDYKKDYAAAEARGDAAGMKAANDGANAIRRSTGLKEETANVAISNMEKKSSSSSSSGSGSNSNKSTSLTDSSRATGGTNNTMGNSNHSLYGGSNVAYDDNGNIDFGATFTNYKQSGADWQTLQDILDDRAAKAAANAGYNQWSNDSKQIELQQIVDSMRDREELERQREELDRYYDELDSIKNQTFSYDLQSDPLYEIYKNIFTREGQNAQTDTLADVAALTGGLPSSYAVTASQQALNNYMQKIADIAPELEAAAYQKFATGKSTNIDLLDRLANAYNTSYQRYRDQVADSYNWNRAKTSDNQFNQQFDYNKEQDAKAYEQWLAEFDESKRRALVDEAISKGQLSVSQGNLALQQAKFYADQNASEDIGLTDDSYILLETYANLPDNQKAEWYDKNYWALSPAEQEALDNFIKSRKNLVADSDWTFSKYLK